MPNQYIFLTPLGTDHIDHKRYNVRFIRMQKKPQSRHNANGTRA